MADTNAIEAVIAQLRGLVSANENTSAEFTVAEIWARYREHKIAENPKWGNYSWRSKSLLVWFALWPVKLVTPAAWADYRVARKRSGGAHGKAIKAYTTNLEMHELRGCFSWAVRSGLISINPLQHCRVEKTESRRHGWLAEDQLQALLAAIDIPQWRTYVLVVADTGLRRSEALNLRWVDVKTGYAVVRADESKTKKTRKVKLTARALTAIEGLAQARRAGVPWVFPNGLGKRMAGTTLNKLFRRWADTSGIAMPRGERLVIHTLRHSFATNSIRRKVRLDALSKTLGHTTIQMTAKYLHQNQADIDEVTDLYEAGMILEASERRGPKRAQKIFAEKNNTPVDSHATPAVSKTG